MIEKRIRYFDDGGSSSDSSGSDSGSSDTSDSNTSDQSAAETARLQQAEAAAAEAANAEPTMGDPNQGPQEPTMGTPNEGPQVPEAPAPKNPYEGYTTGQVADPTSPAYVADKASLTPEAKWYDSLVRNLPSLNTLGGIASIAFPALRVPMMVANTAQSINNDPSASNILGTLAAAPIARMTGLTPGAVTSLARGDVGSAVGNQVVGTAMGDVNRAIGPDAAKALSFANMATGATGEAKQSIASAINNVLSNGPTVDRSVSVTQAEPGAQPVAAAEPATYTPTHSNPVTANIASILGVRPVAAAAAKGKQVPIDIVQQLMAMQNPTGNLESVPAKTGGSIDDLIRLTRS